MATDTRTIRTRYPGSRPFTQDDEGLFFGRDEDIVNLTTFINVEKTIVLYGKSGLGKSSLLNAGVLPKLEKEHQYFIIPLRFGSYSQGNLKHPLDIVEEKLVGLSRQESFLNQIEPEDISLWQHIKDLELANQDRPAFLLVFDQFEELFTYPEGADDFAEALAELLYNRMPKNFQRLLRLATKNNSNPLTTEQWEFLERPFDLKALMSIRSDHMSHLDRLSSHIPSILQNCYELKPLSRNQAEDAITAPAQKAGEFQSPTFAYHPAALEKILNYLTQNGEKPIESFQLQILCQYVEETIVIKQNDTFVEEPNLGDLEKIYQNYYDFSLQMVGTADEQHKARVFIEEGLIFEKEERRMSMYEGQIQSAFNIGQELLRKLVDVHIIRAEPHGSGGYLYELSHDTLVAPILKAKARRYQEEQAWKIQQQLLEKKKKRKRKRFRALIFFVLPIFSVFVSLILLIILALIYSAYDNPKLGTLGTALRLISFPFIAFLFFLYMMAPFAFFYELYHGESVLSKLRKRAEDPAKQEGILTELGKWLS